MACVLVRGAGSPDLDGLYVATGRSHEAELFENDRRCLLSREPHKSRRARMVIVSLI